MIDYMQDQQANSLEATIDKDEYKNDQLISIKTSLNLPYYTSSEKYVRTYGSINVNGIDYEYVKRRVYHDTLELLCLPNDAKTKLQSAKIEFYKIAADGNTSGTNKKSSNTLKISLPDFFQNFTTFSFGNILETKKKHFTSNNAFTIFDYTARQERPPQSMRIIT